MNQCAVALPRTIEIIEKFIRNHVEYPWQFPDIPSITEAYNEIIGCSPGTIRASWRHKTQQFAFYISLSGELISLEYYGDMIKSYFRYIVVEEEEGERLK